MPQLCDGLVQTRPEARSQAAEILAIFGESVDALSPELERPATLVGRKETLAELVSLRPVERRTQRPMIVVVRGRSGMGKSALLKEFQRLYPAQLS